MIREAAFAGQFYPADAEELRRELARLLRPAERRRALAVVVPHAAYMYSGQVAGAVYSSVELPRRFVVLCPNHTGYGAAVAIMSEGGWRTPLGVARIDAELARAIKGRSALFQEDSLAHKYEHSLEVHLPFLQHAVADPAFVPICIGTGSLASLKEIGRALAEAIAETGETVLLIGSTDMTHYEPAELARGKDRLAIDRIVALDPDGLHAVVKREKITMCGYAPTVAVLEAAALLGAQKGELLAYANSGDVTGDYQSVVGYAGLVVS